MLLIRNRLPKRQPYKKQRREVSNNFATYKTALLFFLFHLA
jgi:hypothetical protein